MGCARVQLPAELNLLPGGSEGGGQGLGDIEQGGASYHYMWPWRRVGVDRCAHTTGDCRLLLVCCCRIAAGPLLRPACLGCVCWCAARCPPPQPCHLLSEMWLCTTSPSAWARRPNPSSSSCEQVGMKRGTTDAWSRPQPRDCRPGTQPCRQQGAEQCVRSTEGSNACRLQEWAANTACRPNQEPMLAASWQRCHSRWVPPLRRKQGCIRPEPLSGSPSTALART